MEKKLQDYLHYYLGCRVKAAPYGGQKDRWEEGKLIGLNIYDVVYVKLDKWQSVADIDMPNVKPILLKVENITDEQIKLLIGWDKLNNMYQDVSFNRSNIGIVIKYSIDCEFEGVYPQIHHILFHQLSPIEYEFLLKEYFDLFGLIKSGLAIDASTLTK